jgi:hypothetical protein
MRCLALALLIAFAAPGSTAEKLSATDQELKTASHLYSQDVQEAIKVEWLIESNREKYLPNKEFLVMHVILDEAGKVQETKVIESEGNVTLLEQVTLTALKRAKLKPMPPKLANSLRARKLSMPSILIKVPFPSSSDESRQQEPTTFKALYMRQVTQRVEAKWHQLRKLKNGQLSFGSLKLHLLMGPKGEIAELKIDDDKESNKELTDMTIEAIKSIKLSAMPPEVIEELKSEGLKHLKIEYNVLIY